MIRILHFGRTNIAGVPGAFVRAHRAAGNRALLATERHSAFGYPTDVCFNYPKLGAPLLRCLAGRKRTALRSEMLHFEDPALDGRPGSLPARMLVGANEIVRWLWLQFYLRRYDLLNYDIYHLEGGMGFMRDGRYIRRLHQRGKRIVANYHGSDLRRRGINPRIDPWIDLHLTSHPDLIPLHPQMVYLPMPFEIGDLRPKGYENKPLRICHAPSNRALKGTEQILAVVEDLQRSHALELVLIENKSHRQALEIMRSCDLMIDQILIGSYGVASLEALACGLPTCVYLRPEVEQFLGDHPFVNVSAQTLRGELLRLITDGDHRQRLQDRGLAWLRAVHDPRQVVARLYALYAERGWLDADGSLLPAGEGRGARR